MPGVGEPCWAGDFDWWGAALMRVQKVVRLLLVVAVEPTCAYMGTDVIRGSPRVHAISLATVFTGPSNAPL